MTLQLPRSHVKDFSKEVSPYKWCGLQSMITTLCMCVCLIPYYIVRKNLELVTIGPQRIKQNVEGSELTGILQYGNLKIHLQERRLKEIMTFPDSQDLGNFLKIFR